MTDYPSGIGFPFRFSSSGGVARAEGVDKLRANLQSIAKTSVNERVMRKGIGTIGYQQVFRNTTDHDFEWISGLILAALAKDEPRVIVKSVTLRKEDKELYIDIEAFSRSSGDPVDVQVKL
jgi:phage baseplate assembly protein W